MTRGNGKLFFEFQAENSFLRVSNAFGKVPTKIDFFVVRSMNTESI